jgi:hypothetical protein
MSFVIGAMIIAKFFMGANEIQGKTNQVKLTIVFN